MAELEAAQQALARFLEEAGARARGAYHAQLVFEELVSNVLRYAYPGGIGPIDVVTALAGGEIQVTVEDQGPAFNPLLAPEPPAASSLEEAQVGGRGISLVRMASTHIDYQRDGARNRVCVRIRND